MEFLFGLKNKEWKKKIPISKEEVLKLILPIVLINIEVYPKTILNKVKSPDIPTEYSMNPYQG